MAFSEGVWLTGPLLSAQGTVYTQSIDRFRSSWMRLFRGC